MAWRSKPNEQPSIDHIENVLGKTLKVEGDLKADGAFRIDGTVHGSVESKAAVIVGEAGAVHGDVVGTDVVVAGHVEGNIRCTGHLEIVSTGKVDGDIEAKSVRIETGGAFNGKSKMGGVAPVPSAESSDGKSGRLTSVG